MRGKRIAVLTHSVNPRGGVVHAMHLAEALCDAGHDATLFAPAEPGRRFFRPPRCPHHLIPAAAVAGVAAMVGLRIGEIAKFLAAGPQFEIFHAHDPIGANALAQLRRAGVIGGFIRTVHHLDHFDDPRLAAWQDAGVTEASVHAVVSDAGRQELARRYGVAAVDIGNGVDFARFTPRPDGREAGLRARLGLGGGPVFLALGGIEPRKNTRRILRAFRHVLAEDAGVRLVIAGGATLLDHAAYQAGCDAELAACGQAVIRAGVIDDADMPALYRIADALVSPSAAEGFGLCALEAMASGRPAIVAAIAPFTEHFRPAECLWADPASEAGIAAAMRAALDPRIAAPLAAAGPAVARRFGWDGVAAAHAPLYAAVMQEMLADA